MSDRASFDLAAMGALERDITAVVEQVEQCLKAQEPITSETVDQLHQLRNVAELMFARAG
jgi:hypothetical protein